MEERPIRFRDLLQSMEVRPGSQIPRIIEVSWAVHELRVAGKQEERQRVVSRTSILFACYLVEGGVRKALENADLNDSRWRRELKLPVGLDAALRSASPVDDFEVDPAKISEALQFYAREFTRRPLDATGLAWAVLRTGDSGHVVRHAVDAGLHIERGIELLHHGILKPRTAQQRPSERPGKLSREAQRNRSKLTDEISVPGQEWLPDISFSYSEFVKAIITMAKALADGVGTDQPVGTSLILIAALQLAEKNPTSACAFLQQVIVKSGGEKRLRNAISSWLSEFRKYPSQQNVAPSGLSDFAVHLLEQAQEIAVQASTNRMIRGRHLIGAFLSFHPPAASGSDAFLATLDLSRDDLLDRFLSFLQANAPKQGADDLDAWHHLLRSTPVLRNDEGRASLLADTTHGVDLLDIRPDVNAFAHLISSRTLIPPLSIGLFGEWGSGKSFFMRKLKERVEEVSTGSEPSRIEPFYRRIVQIEFNAWHYVEANLWASLVEHIFRNLRFSEAEKEEQVERRRVAVLQRVNQAIADRLKAEKRVQDAQIDHEKASADVTAKQQSIDSKASHLQWLLSVDVWEIVDLDQGDRDAVEKALKELGISRVLQSNREIRDALQSVEGIAQRSRMLWLSTFHGPGAGIRVALLILSLALFPLLWWGIQWFAAEAADQPATQRAIARVGEMVTGIGAVCAWIAGLVARGNRALARIDQAKGRIDAKLAERDRFIADQIKTERDTRDDAGKELNAAIKNLEDADAELATAKKELLSLTGGQRLARFIDERVASDDYRKLLGVLAMVRGDFETLSKLMKDSQKSDYVPIEDDFQIDRIVLYIDDLDRCPPKRVMEVLQAVHLLLAFPLFVVVVGVDARWIYRSLERRHQLMWKSPDRDHVDVLDELKEAGTPRDYLEKIFQIPFWVQPMSTRSTERYLEGLISVESSGTSSGVPKDSAALPTQVLPEADKPIGELEMSYPPSETKEETPGDIREQQPAEPAAEALNSMKTDRISAEELSFMKKLAPLVKRSPRAVKRFVNTYRLVRARVSSSEIKAFLGNTERPGSYRAALLLLGISIVSPDIIDDLYRFISERRDLLDVDELLLELAGDKGPAIRQNPEVQNLVKVLHAIPEIASIQTNQLRGFLPQISRYSFLRMPELSPRDLPASRQLPASRPQR